MTKDVANLDFIHRVVGIAKIGFLPSDANVARATKEWGSVKDSFAKNPDQTKEMDRVFTSLSMKLSPSQDTCRRALKELDSVRMPERIRARASLSEASRPLAPRH